MRRFGIPQAWLCIAVIFSLVLSPIGALAAPLGASSAGGDAGPAVATSSQVASQAATLTAVTLRVESARQWIPSGLNKGDAIPTYQWVIVKDDTGDPAHYGTTLGPMDLGNSNYACVPAVRGGDPAYPANCKWPSIHAASGGTSGQLVAQGDQGELNQIKGLDFSAPGMPGPGKYMISVTARGFDVPNCTPSATVTCTVDGFKIDGQWFDIPNQTGVVTVAMQPYPLPFTTVRMQVWNDLQTNGAYDTGEPYLSGFEGHIDDVLGAVTTDWYGNPLCTKYQHDSGGLLLFGGDGRPLVATIGGHCFSDANGLITIPYLGPDRYAATVVAPNGQQWFQTSTLEGWHDWDVWAIEGWDGYDPEFVQGAEPFAFAEFGFVQLQSALVAPATGSIKGTVVGTSEFAPAIGGANLGGFGGQKILENIKSPLLSLLNMGGNDNTVYVGRGDASGAFQISNVPDGDYVLSYWDEDQAYLLAQTTISVQNGQALDMGVLDIAAWWSRVTGKVCFDANRNGKCDTGERGMPNLALNLLGRDNSVQFYGDNTAVTDLNGKYSFPRAYPLGQWVVAQGYWEQFYTVGVTYQTNNQPTETTMMANGGFVDVSTFNLIGMNTRLDWAIHTYETDASLGPTNGGIVGEVVYDPTRNELDARLEATEPYEPGVPGINVHLYWPARCDPAAVAPSGQTCTQGVSPFGNTTYYLTDNLTGAYVKGHEAAAPYTTETWLRPTDCVARGPDGNVVVEQVLPPSTGGHDCLEAPLMSSQVGNNSVGDFMQVNGNYGFTQIARDVNGNPVSPRTDVASVAPGSSVVADSSIQDGDAGAAVSGTGIPDDTFIAEVIPGVSFTLSKSATGAGTSVTVGGFIAVPAGDWLVQVELPTDPMTGKPAWSVTKEEDINVMSGDQFVAAGETPLNPPLPAGVVTPTPAPAIPPFACAGALHTVHVVDDTAQALFDPLNPAATSGVYNPDFLNAGGSPFEGMRMPLCDTKLVTVRAGRSATPNFYLFTPVPLPGRVFGVVVDDLNLSVNPRELFFGEKYGIPNLPIGIYDFSNRLVTTIETDPNGSFEVILPSTSSYNCPLPAGPCPGIYRFYANDPGQPGHLNPGYNPGYRSIGAFFEVWPGVSLPADLAPSPVAIGTGTAGTQNTQPARCLLNDPAQPSAPKIPELFSISKPYARSSDSGTARQRTISGQAFGATAGDVTLDGVSMPIASWSDTSIVFLAPYGDGSGASAFDSGPHQLRIKTSAGQSTVNGLTFHELGGGYNPVLYEVGPGRTGTRQFNSTDANPNFAAHAIQRAIEASAVQNGSRDALVVVYPNQAGVFNPLGSYYENLIIHSTSTVTLKLQGVGPGGVRPDGSHVIGTVLDGLGYGTDGPRETAWAAILASIGTILGPNGLPANAATAAVPEGEVILVVSDTAVKPGQLPLAARPLIDGLLIQNGDVMDFVPNTSTLGNGALVGGGNNAPTNPNQGGGIVAFASIQNLEITNNVIRSNSGAYGGAIRLGTPLVGDNNLDFAHIANNRILNNGGTNLAGAVAVFNGTPGYEINNNDICGNFSAEYGGGISHFGLSTGSRIHDNRIYFNGSYDEGGGIIVAGEPAVTLTGLSAGAGAVDIYNNIIQANIASDDGGGLRLLEAGNFPFNVYNNMIVNNISAHEGGGVAIDNAPNVRFFNNTVMKNITTATAATSNGQPVAAGLTTARNSNYLQATLPAGSPLFSDPLMFNNIFWDNRAGAWDPNAGLVRGIGGTNAAGVLDSSPINYWDMAVPGTSYLLSPTYSILDGRSTNPGAASSPTNRLSDPIVVQTYDTSVVALPWRGDPHFVGNVIVAHDVPISIMGNYHLSGAASPAVDQGTSAVGAIAAPAFDIDYNGRPARAGFDIGADELENRADLSITKTDGVPTVSSGQTVTYTISVTNTGPDAVVGARVRDVFPTDLNNVRWCRVTSGTTCTPSTDGGIDTLIDLANGGTATFIARGRLATNPTRATLVNTATVTAPATTTDTNTANNSATDTDGVTANADLRITKNVSSTFATPGGQVTYTIAATNLGPDSAPEAVVTDTFPAALENIQWCRTTGTTCTPSTAGNIADTVSVASGSTYTYIARGTLAVGTTVTSLSNTATIAGAPLTTDPILANNSATANATVFPVLPLKAVLDDFNRTASSPTDATHPWVWQGQGTGNLTPRFTVNGSVATTSNTAGGFLYWRATTGAFGANQEAFITIKPTSDFNQDLQLKMTAPGATSPTNNHGSSFIRVRYTGKGATEGIRIGTVVGGTTVDTGIVPAIFNTDDVLLARAMNDGTVEVYRITGTAITLVATANVTTQTGTAWTAAMNAAGGYIGIDIGSGGTTPKTFDNFGGGTLP